MKQLWKALSEMHIEKKVILVLGLGIDLYLLGNVDFLHSFYYTAGFLIGNIALAGFCFFNHNE